MISRGLKTGRLKGWTRSSGEKSVGRPESEGPPVVQKERKKNSPSRRQRVRLQTSRPPYQYRMTSELEVPSSLGGVGGVVGPEVRVRR